MEATVKPTQNTESISPNRALYQRFMDLPRSEREKMQMELEQVRLWWHFKTYLSNEGNDLGDAKAKAVVILNRYLGVTVEQLAANDVQFLPYAEFAKPVLA